MQKPPAPASEPNGPLTEAEIAWYEAQPDGSLGFDDVEPVRRLALVANPRPDLDRKISREVANSFVVLYPEIMRPEHFTPSSNV
jgi:hypothetical protein